jgi:hypothetical protein
MRRHDLSPGGSAEASAQDGVRVADRVVVEDRPPMRDRTRSPATAADEPGAEDTLSALRQRFEKTDDPQAQGELAVEALDYVERQLGLMREQRQQLDSHEGKLWATRNRLERLLIDTRGRDWWHARRDRVRARTLASPYPSRSTRGS